MECQLRIDWHRHDPPGTILSPSGDIDNRLKTLFDALRMPQNDTEIPEGAAHHGIFLCLLEDDSLITKLSVDTSQILGQGQFGPNDVELTLHVAVKAPLPHERQYRVVVPLTARSNDEAVVRENLRQTHGVLSTRNAGRAHRPGSGARSRVCRPGVVQSAGAVFRVGRRFAAVLFIVGRRPRGPWEDHRAAGPNGPVYSVCKAGLQDTH
jgi:hypothetical protein